MLKTNRFEITAINPKTTLEGWKYKSPAQTAEVRKLSAEVAEHRSSEPESALRA